MLTSTCFFDKIFVQSLRDLQTQDRYKLIQSFWPHSDFSLGTIDDHACTSFLEYVADELDRIQHHKPLFAALDLDGVFAIIQVFKANLSKPCQDILSDLSSRFLNVDPEAVRRSMELSARLWLTYNIRSAEISAGSESADEIPVEWPLELSLNELLGNQFKSRARTQHRDIQSTLDPDFTVAYLVNTCGVTLRWTNDIATHLDFDLRRLVLSVYRHKACLMNHLEKPSECPIPEDVLREILSTLDLLFPFGDVATRRLLVREGQKSLFSLGIHETYQNLELSHYKYYGTQLTRLIDAFNKTPRTWRQLALDRRNKLEWSAFWVTVMVAVLTLVSIPCNIIQATYSVKAYQVTLAQTSKA